MTSLVSPSPVQRLPLRVVLEAVLRERARRARQAVVREHEFLLPPRVACRDGLAQRDLLQPAPGARDLEQVVDADRRDDEATLLAPLDQIGPGGPAETAGFAR